MLRLPLLSTGGIIVLLMTPAWLDAQDQRSSLLDADRDASELSSDSGLTAAAVRAIHSTAVLLWPGAPVLVGTSDIGRFLSALPNRDSLRLTWQPLGAELARDSTLGVTWGVAVATARLVPTPPRVGRYIAAWRRDAGRWTIAALLFLGIHPVAALPGSFRLTQPAAQLSGSTAPFVAADLAFAQLAGDSGVAVAFRRWAAPEAMIFGGGGLLTRGPKAIGQNVAGPAAWQWRPVAAGAAQSEDLGWTVGEAVIAGNDADPTYSKYLTVWVRPQGRPIRFLMDGGNARPPSP